MPAASRKAGQRLNSPLTLNILLAVVVLKRNGDYVLFSYKSIPKNEYIETKNEHFIKVMKLVKMGESREALRLIPAKSRAWFFIQLVIKVFSQGQ